jgi:hypothetical protein
VWFWAIPMLKCWRVLVPVGNLDGFDVAVRSPEKLAMRPGTLMPGVLDLGGLTTEGWEMSVECILILHDGCNRVVLALMIYGLPWLDGGVSVLVVAAAVIC